MPQGPVRAASALASARSRLSWGIGGGTPAILIMTMSGVNIYRAVATAAGFGTIIAVPALIGSMITGFGQQNLARRFDRLRQPHRAGVDRGDELV